MIIECPACSKKFNIDEKLIPDEGRLLKCGNCENTWFFKKDENIKAEAETTKINEIEEKKSEINLDPFKETNKQKKKIRKKISKKSLTNESTSKELVSIDKRIGSKNIIEENAKRLGVNPSLIIEDEALNIFRENKITHNLLHPDRVIIGGGGSNSDLIIQEVLKKINSICILIIPLISLKSLSKLESILKSKVNKLSISQHQSYRGINIGEDIRLSPLNPVFILKGEIK